MKRRPASVVIGGFFGLALLGHLSPLHAFTSITRSTFSAVATVTGGNSLQTLVLSTSTILNTQGVVFYKNVVIPLRVINLNGPIDPNNLRVDIVYQLQGNGLPPTGTPWSHKAATLARDPFNATALTGYALVPRSELSGLPAGGVFNYYFSASQTGTSDTVLVSSGNMSAPANSGVNGPPRGTNSFASGSVLSAPGGALVAVSQQPVGPGPAYIPVLDDFVNDGQTSVSLPNDALSAVGSLEILAENARTWPSGPGNLNPLLVFTMKLEGASLVRPAQVTLSYPAEPDGRVIDTPFHGGDLALYWYNGSQWILADRSVVDTTLHTVSGTTTRLGTFALFPTGGAPAAADVRTKTRIITPNGDGINDTALFQGIHATDEIKIFDIRGRRVRTIRGMEDPSWDGRDDDGKIVESGVYIYQYTSQGERVSGVIGVAK